MSQPVCPQPHSDMGSILTLRELWGNRNTRIALVINFELLTMKLLLYLQSFSMLFIKNKLAFFWDASESQ